MTKTINKQENQQDPYARARIEQEHTSEIGNIIQAPPTRQDPNGEPITFKPGIPEEHQDNSGLRLRERETQHTGNVVEAEFTVDPHHANTPTPENHVFNQEINTTGAHLTSAFTQDVSAVTTSGGTSLDINPCDDSD